MRRILFVLIASFISVLVQSQEQVIDESSTKIQYLIKYDPNASGDNSRILNSIIEEIAKQPHKNKFSIEITFNYIQHVRITKKGEHVNVYVDIKNFNGFGDIYYKEFSIADAIMPEMMSMKVWVSGKHKANEPEKTLAQFIVPPTSLNDKKNTFSFVFKDTLGNEHYSVTLKDVEFIFNENTKRNFLTRLDQIDDYYRTNMKMEKIFSDLDVINPQDIDHLDNSRNILNHVNGFIDETERRNISRNLELEFFDPLDFVKKFNDLKNETFNLTQSVNHTIATLHEIYYNRGLGFIASNNRQMARNMFMKSIEINPMYAPPLYQLAKMDLLDGNYDSAAYKVIDLFNKLKPDENIYRIGMELAKNLFDAYLASGDNFYNDQKYQEALNVYQKTQFYCNSVKGFTCPDVLGYKISMSRVGIYNSFLANANKYIQQGDLIQAEKEVRDALKYQNDYPNEIKDNRSAVVALNNIMQINYKNTIAEGKSFVVAKNYEAAFTTFQKAENIEKMYQISRSSELPTLLKQSAKPVIIAEVNKGISLAQQNQLQEARNIITEIANIQNNYGLGDDITINNLIGELRKKIFSQECQNAQNEYDTYFNNAKNFINNKAFISADDEFNKAEAVISRNVTCGIDNSKLDTTRRYIVQAITYEKIIAEGDGFLSNNFFQKALPRYIDAEKYYYQFNVSRFGITRLSLMDFISQEENAFVIYSLNYFLNNDDLDKSQQLLNVLRQRNYKSKKLKNEQKLLGTKLAIRDIKNGSKLKGDQAVIIYTNKDSWYNNLRKAYLKAYK